MCFGYFRIDYCVCQQLCLPCTGIDFAMAASVSPQLLSEEEEEEEEEEKDSSAAHGLVLLFCIPVLSCTLAWFVHV